jgi:hypothetical protein
MALAAPLRFPFPEHLDEALAELNKPNEEAVSNEEAASEEVEAESQKVEVVNPPSVSEQVQVLPKNNSESLLNATIKGILGIFKKPIEQPLTTPTLTPNPVIQPNNSEAKLKPIISSIINIFKERQEVIPASNGRTAVTAVNKPDDAKLRTLVSGIIDLFKKKSAIIINPITNMPGQTLTPADTKLKNVLKTVIELFKKPDTVLSSKIALTSIENTKERNLQLLLGTVYKLFEREPSKVEKKDEFKWSSLRSSLLPNMKNIEKMFTYERPNIEYEPDIDREKALKYLETDELRGLYEPIHTYVEEGSTQGEFVYKLKKQDATKEPIIRRRGELHAA